MQALATAINEERWEQAALLLLNALLRVADRLPDKTVLGLLEALEGNSHAQEE